ncbi:MAG: L-histidine N(alpha)-methyltransferase [Firmicutes bacterium]|nr:L-histidine N(alpha)-methyltransferase [Alicyclobacillaceae bacterium]MCL6496513.1 L-histidine N(alpha)-methyltransferase [Bacillota bacterium]
MGPQELSGVSSTSALERDVLQGLSQPQKAIPCKYLYDAEGCRLFEAITQVPEYYLTRAECEILGRLGTVWPSTRPRPKAVAELGPGNGEKTVLLLAALPEVAVYLPVDIAPSGLEATVARVRDSGWAGAIQPQVADYSGGWRWPEAGPLPRLVAFLGSSIGNFEPAEAVAFLRRLGAGLEPGDGLLVGVDLEKDRQRLEAAYNDRRGVTAAFNRNLLVRLNRELGADFDPEAFDHLATYNAARHRVELYLVSRTRQEVAVGGRRFSFGPGERIHVENSYKYSLAGFRTLLQAAGWHPERVWLDRRGDFALYLAGV